MCRKAKQLGHVHGQTYARKQQDYTRIFYACQKSVNDSATTREGRTIGNDPARPGRAKASDGGSGPAHPGGA